MAAATCSNSVIASLALERKTSDLVIFDLDGVLVDTQYAEDASLLCLAKRMGLALGGQAGTLFSGKRLAECINLLERLSGRPAPEDAVEFVRAECERILGPTIEPIEGVQEALQQIPLAKCVASNSPRLLIERRLASCALARHFSDRVFSAYDVHSWKPEPKLFLSAAAACGVAPAQCCVIEDSEVGVRAAVAAGMRVLQFTNHRSCQPYGVGVKTFAHMSQLPRLL